MKISTLSAIAAMALATASCAKEEPGSAIPDGISGILVLNNGNWGSNDASISMYDPATGKVTPGMFLKVNGKKLGDLGQDILRHGDELFIAVNGSRMIYVTDLGLRIKAEIHASADGSDLSPKYLAASEDRIYVSYYEGYAGEIDPATHSVRTTPVGPNPEGLAYSGGKVYVADSGGLMEGYCSSISVVDAATFTETGRIEVNVNPQNVVASGDGTKIYVSSFGNYADKAPMLQVIDLASGKVSDSGYSDVKSIAMGSDDRLLVVTGTPDENWNISADIHLHDASGNKPLGTFGEGGISPFHSISADPSSGAVFIGKSDYRTSGDVIMLDREGRTTVVVDAGGLNPIKCMKL